MERDKDDKSAEEGSLWLAGVKGFEPLIYSLGGCRLVLARLHAHDGFLEGETGISRFPARADTHCDEQTHGFGSMLEKSHYERFCRFGTFNNSRDVHRFVLYLNITTRALHFRSGFFRNF